MQFFISSYGDKFVPLISTCLFSLRKQHPDISITVYYDDINQCEITLLKTLYPDIQIDHVPTKATDYSSREVEHSYPALALSLEHQLHFLKKLNTQQNQRNELIVFVDADMLFQENITQAIPSKTSIDFLYTLTKETNRPLNLGLFIVRNNKQSLKFMERWLNIIEKVIGSDKQSVQACVQAGGIQQFSFYKLLKKKPGELPAGSWKKTFEFGQLNLFGAQRKELNQTSGVPVNSGAKVFHFCGGWRRVLLDQPPYSQHPQVSAENNPNSQDLLERWDDIYNRQNKIKAKKTVLNSAKSFLNINDFNFPKNEQSPLLNSEIIAILSLIEKFNIDLILTSDNKNRKFLPRLVNLLADSNIEIHAITDAKNIQKYPKIFQQKLKKYNNIYIYCDAENRKLLKIQDKNPEKKTVLCLPGDKFKGEVDLLKKSFINHPNTLIGIIHQMHQTKWGKPHSSRFQLEQKFDRIFFTDDTDYIDMTCQIDKPHPESPDEAKQFSWSPYHLGWQNIDSYGPTLGIIFPTYRDRIKNKYTTRKKSIYYKNKQIKKLIKNLLGGKLTNFLRQLKRKIENI